jgi:hypothetical protein
VARNRSAARLVRLAAMLTRKSQAKARCLQARLGGNAGPAGLEPDPAKAGIPVDDKPNPFQDGTDDPDVCLRGPWLDNVVPMLAQRARFSAADLAGHMFQAGTEAEPGLPVFGQGVFGPGVFGPGDGLGQGGGQGDGQRAERVRGSGRASPA